jgi:hypothetical protein
VYVCVCVCECVCEFVFENMNRLRGIFKHRREDNIKIGLRK